MDIAIILMLCYAEKNCNQSLLSTWQQLFMVASGVGHLICQTLNEFSLVNYSKLYRSKQYRSKHIQRSERRTLDPEDYFQLGGFEYKNRKIVSNFF